ncbi:MAG: AAA family ATPase [Eubacteriaceae bacterium]|nr:AAA family ATPase [Eubacteriaceae bacterium]
MLIEGARRVGKSTIAEKFGLEQYRSYILIDFNKAPKSVKDDFDNMNELDIFYQNLSLEYITTPFSQKLFNLL